jgi:hypothetical protein
MTMIVENVGVERKATRAEGVKTLPTASIKPITTVDGRENMLKRIENMSQEITISNTVLAMILRISTTTRTISSNNIMKLCAEQILRRITNGTQSTWQ